MENDRLLTATETKYVVNALESTKIRFVRDTTDFTAAEGFEPEFAHQHFGENEVIFGYQDLQLDINYTDASLFVYPKIKYGKTVSKDESGAKPDDVYNLLREQLPKDQLHMMVETKEQFFAHLEKQRNFKPFGEMVDRFNAADKQFELYLVNESSEDFDNYLARIQSLALWYIDAADYTDNSDARWLHYLLYQAYPNPEGDGSRRYAIAGYVSCYRFYHHPAGERVRIAQVLLFPQYRRGGLGPRLLQSLYRDLNSQKSVFDITAEDPADNFIFLRDYVDCLNCKKMPEFAEEKLKEGFSGEMQNAALNHHKIHHKQARRVYEILRYIATDKKDEEALKAYRLDVKRRLEAPMKKDKAEWKRINKALDEEEAARLAATEMNGEVKVQQLSSMYDETIAGYKIVIERLENYPEII